MATGFLKTKAWAELREKALTRDNRRCCLCGGTDNLCVHHILYRRGWKTCQADLDNLVTLCKSCHWKVHKSAGNLHLAMWLQDNRPVQMAYVTSHYMMV